MASRGLIGLYFLIVIFYRLGKCASACNQDLLRMGAYDDILCYDSSGLLSETQANIRPGWCQHLCTRNSKCLYYSYNQNNDCIIGTGFCYIRIQDVNSGWTTVMARAPKACPISWTENSMPPTENAPVITSGARNVIRYFNRRLHFFWLE